MPNRLHSCYLDCLCGTFNFEQYSQYATHLVTEQNCPESHMTRHFDDCPAHPLEPRLEPNRDGFSVEKAQQKVHRNSAQEQRAFSEPKALLNTFNECRCNFVTSGVEQDPVRRQIILANRLLFDGQPCSLHQLCCGRCHFSMLQIGMTGSRNFGTRMTERDMSSAVVKGELQQQQQERQQWSMQKIAVDKEGGIEIPGPQPTIRLSDRVKDMPQDENSQHGPKLMRHVNNAEPHFAQVAHWANFGDPSPTSDNFRNMTPNDVSLLKRKTGPAPHVETTKVSQLTSPLARSISKSGSVTKERTAVAKVRPLSKTNLYLQYDPQTLACDILRVAGIHPRLPPLNAHVPEIRRKRGRPRKYATEKAAPQQDSVDLASELSRIKAKWRANQKNE